MELRILGCHGPSPCPGGATSGYLVSLPGGNVLLDCGAGVMGKLLEYADPSALTGVVLSHAHYDHMSDLYVMRYFLERLGAKLPVYLPRAAMDSPVAQSLTGGAFTLLALEDLTEIAGAEIASLPVRHPVPACAVKMTSAGKTLVYTGDTNTCDDLAAFCQDADLMLADGALLKEQWTKAAPHMSASLAAELARNANVKRLIVTHLLPQNLPSALLKQAREAFPDAMLATPGQLISL